jgi:hypothetical protein
MMMATSSTSRPITPDEIAELLGINKTTLNRNKARVYLATLVLLRLSTSGTTRKELFAPGSDADETVPTLRKEGSGRGWQSDYLAALAERGVIEESTGGGTKVYFLTDALVRDSIIDNVIAGNQEMLKAILWPQDYVPIVAEGEDGEESEEDDDEPVPEILSIVASRLGDVGQHLSALYQTSEKSTDSSIKTQTALTEVATRLEIMLARFEYVVGEDERRIRAGLMDMVTRLQESETRKKSLMNQLEAESRKAEAVLDAIQTLLINAK